MWREALEGDERLEGVAAESDDGLVEGGVVDGEAHAVVVGEGRGWGEADGDRGGLLVTEEEELP